MPNISQIKVNGFKQVINIGLAFSTKEMQDYAATMGFSSDSGYGFHTFNGTKKAIQGMLSLDQVQGHNEVAFLGFGYTIEEDRESAPNGIYYRMEMDEKGEGKNVNGTIKYVVVQVKRDGKLYEVDTTFKKQDQTTIEKDWTFTYRDKSTKNSTLFKMVRRYVENGYITKEIPKFLKLVKTEKAAPSEVKQTTKAPRKRKQA